MAWVGGVMVWKGRHVMWVDVMVSAVETGVESLAVILVILSNPQTLWLADSPPNQTPPHRSQDQEGSLDHVQSAVHELKVLQSVNSEQELVIPSQSH